MNPASLSVGQRVNALVRALNGAKRTNEALARCSNGEEMLDVLLDASAKLGLGLTRQQLANTPPIRDWVWWKNKEALLTIGDNKPRYQQDGGQGKADLLKADLLKADLTNPDPSPTDAPPPRKRFLGLF
jgi:hypothetical protein